MAKAQGRKFPLGLVPLVQPAHFLGETFVGSSPSGPGNFVQSSVGGNDAGVSGKAQNHDGNGKDRGVDQRVGMGPDNV